MRNFSRVSLGVIAGLVVAPLAGLAVASVSSRIGLQEFEFGSHPFTITLGSPLISDLPSGAISFGVLTFLIVATAGGWLFTRLLTACRWGFPFVGLVLLAALSLYSWLASDDPKIVIAPGLLRPAAGVKREPRELFLEGTGNAAFGPLAGWSGEMDTPDDEQVSEKWLRQHSSDIHARWEQLGPVRDWVGRLHRYEGFEDYCEPFGPPVLAYRPIQQYYRASRAEALLAGLEGRYADAAEIEGQALAFGRRLRNGSRCLVHLMVGEVVEKGTLGTIQILVERYPASARACDGIPGLVQSPGTEWDDLERVFRNEAMGMQARFTGPGAFDRGLSGWIEAFFWNPNATAGVYRDHLMAIAAASRRSDFALAETEEGDYATLRMRLHFKNFLGPFVLHDLSPNTPKITRELEAMIKLREHLAAKLQAKRAPEANVTRIGNSEGESST